MTEDIKETTNGETSKCSVHALETLPAHAEPRHLNIFWIILDQPFVSQTKNIIWVKGN